jgi:hypothetical protein
MNYPAACGGVSPKALNAPRGGEYNPKVNLNRFYLVVLFSKFLYDYP